MIKKIGSMLCAVMLVGCEKASTGISETSPPQFTAMPQTDLFSMEKEEPVRYRGQKTYSDGLTCNPGHWQLKDETWEMPEREVQTESCLTAVTVEDGKLLLTVTLMQDVSHDSFTAKKGEQISFTVTESSFEEAYLPGAACQPRIAIRRKGDTASPYDPLSGSLYFAEGEQVREYFLRQSGAADPRVFLDGFTTEKDKGRDGSTKDADGTEEFWYWPKAFFPQCTADGDEVSVVLALSVEDTLLLQHVRVYAWVADEPAEQEEESHEGEQYWMMKTYSGHWDLQDIRYYGTDRENVEGSVRVQRTGTDGQNILYTFANGSTVDIPAERFDRRYYPGDVFIPEIVIFSSSSNDGEAAVTCSLAWCEIKEGDRLQITPKQYFTAFWPREEVKAFGPLPHDDTMSWRNDLMRSYLNMNGSFPEGSTDGEKIWLVYASACNGQGDLAMYNVYEYVWSAGPVEVWTYNPPLN